MQRRIQKADGGRPAVERHEDIREIFFLVRKKFLECLGPALVVHGEDHLSDSIDAVALKEHMLGASEANALSPKRDRVFYLLGSVGIGADTQGA